MSRFFDWSHFQWLFPRLLEVVPLTLFITLTSFAVGFLLAVFIALARLYRIPVLNQIAVVYVSFMRGTPILIQLFICNLALPAVIWGITGVNVGRIWSPLIFVIAAYGLNAAAFLSEDFRAAVSGVDSGQQEAALSIGMTRFQCFRYVIASQAVRIAIPGFSNSFSNLLKDSTLAFAAAGIMDLMGTVQAIGYAKYRYLEGYVGAAAIFFALCIFLEFGTHFIIRRLSKGLSAVK
ncbi:MAG: amino acid ABC transporter permease [Clostridiales bacterium]|jgi:L-cystine transport system permease protein|nr:amino acid ABC transporter permease [Clostridiales bacterium]